MPNPGGRPRPGRRGSSASRIAPAGPSFTSSVSRTCSSRTLREAVAEMRTAWHKLVDAAEVHGYGTLRLPDGEAYEGFFRGALG